MYVFYKFKKLTYLINRGVMKKDMIPVDIK